MRLMGASRERVLVLMGAETGFVLTASALIAAAALMLTRAVSASDIVLLLAG